MHRRIYIKPLMSVPSTVRSTIPVVNWILKISGMDTGRIHIQPATLYPRHSSCFKGDILSPGSYEDFCEGFYSVHPRTTHVCPFFRPGTAVRTIVLTDIQSNSGLYPRTILDRSRNEIMRTKHRVESPPQLIE